MAIARATPIGSGGFPLAVQGITQTEQGLVWQVGEQAIGATRWFRISDGTGVVLESGRYKTR